MNLVIIIAAVLLLGSTARADEPRSGPDSLRVWDVRPDTFDLVFTSYSEAADGDWQLALNDRGGRTYFVRVGEMLGHYSVAGFEPFEISVYVPALNAVQFRKSGSVTLEGPAGPARVLKQGQWLETGGYRAIIVSMAGYYWSVREGDRFSKGDAAFTVMKVSPEEVMADSGGLPVIIPSALPEERTQLAEKWKSEARALREARAAAAILAKEETQVSRGSRIGISSRLPATEFFVGREVRIPSEYGVMFLPAGTDGWRPVVIPGKFQTYYDGIRWGSQGMVIEQIPSFAPSWYLPRGSSRSRAPGPSIRVTVVP